ncbi:hypothetical protein [Flavobacterium nitrogenifigens]|uniref:hypothetical protein n=1 Tax=Flavobacterium nitrogenifigens TaxID=1617283 RepID=UPI00142EC747|nr:hypothetical protein [Flavobacterium nitrogenifigens]
MKENTKNTIAKKMAVSIDIKYTFSTKEQSKKPNDILSEKFPIDQQISIEVIVKSIAPNNTFFFKHRMVSFGII